MKRTFPANIDGQIFYIDEDAFELLNSYLEQLRLTFRSAEEQEIVADIESRIRELFDERISGGARVIVLADVNTVIERMGRPEDLSDCRADSDNASHGNAAPEENRPFVSFNLPGRKSLYRNLQNKVFGGVFGGLACYLGWNANIMRLLYVALTVCTYFWPLTVVYLLAWMIIPPAVTPRQLLQMNGDPLNLGTVGQAVMAATPTTVTPPPYREERGFFDTVFSIIGKLLMLFMALISGCISFACLVGFFTVIVGLVAWACFHSANILEGLSLVPTEVGAFSVAGAMCVLPAMSMVFGLITWGALSVVCHFRSASKTVVITTIVLTVILIMAALLLLSIA